MRRTLTALAVVAMAAAGLTGCGDGGGGSGSTEEFCSLDETVDINNVKNLNDFDNALDAGVEAAPDEIRDDIEVVRDTISELTDRLREDGVEDLSDITEEQVGVLQDLNSAEFEQASKNITEFVEANCDTGG